MRRGDKKFAVLFHCDQRSDGGYFLQLMIIFQNLFSIEAAAGRDLKVTDQWGPVSRSAGKSEWRNRIQRLEDVACTGNNCAAERRIEVMFLRDAPGKKLGGVVVAVFHKKTLRNAVLDFIGIGDRGIGVEANEVRKMVYAGHVTVRSVGFDGVFVFARGQVKKSLEGRRSKGHFKFSGISRDGIPTQRSWRRKRVAVTRSTKCRRGGDAEPGPKVQRNGHAWRKFGAKYSVRRVQQIVVAVNG